MAREEARHTQNKSYDEPDEEEAAMADSARRQAEEQEGLGWGGDEDGETRTENSTLLATPLWMRARALRYTVVLVSI